MAAVTTAGVDIRVAIGDVGMYIPDPDPDHEAKELCLAKIPSAAF